MIDTERGGEREREPIKASKASHAQMMLRLHGLRGAARQVANTSQRRLRRQYYSLVRGVVRQPTRPVGWGPRRTYGTGLGLVPRGFILRAFWTTVTAAVGFVYYQVHQASSWMNEKTELLREWGLLSLLGAIDTWNNVAATAEEVASWSPFRWGRKASKGT